MKRNEDKPASSAQAGGVVVPKIPVDVLLDISCRILFEDCPAGDDAGPFSFEESDALVGLAWLESNGYVIKSVEDGREIWTIRSDVGFSDEVLAGMLDQEGEPVDLAQVYQMFDLGRFQEILKENI